jgi:hypothetical protein
MNPGYLQVLLVAAYLLGGTISIVLVMGWALKRRGPSKPHINIPRVQNREKSFPEASSPQPYDASNHFRNN